MKAWRRKRREEEAKPPFATHGTHLRGRVFKFRGTWFFEVINDKSGEVVASDNTNDFTTILTDCHRAVAIARGAWSYGMTRKALGE